MVVVERGLGRVVLRCVGLVFERIADEAVVIIAHKVVPKRRPFMSD